MNNIDNATLVNGAIDEIHNWLHPTQIPGYPPLPGGTKTTVPDNFCANNGEDIEDIENCCRAHAVRLACDSDVDTLTPQWKVKAIGAMAVAECACLKKRQVRPSHD